MKINYNNKKFRAVQTSENGETDEATIFLYKQKGTILSCEYISKKIKKGHLIGLVDDEGNIEMRYHQINRKRELITGICFSKSEILSNNKIRLYETWQ